MKKIYNSKWFPRLFTKRSDGGKDSGVTAYFLIEWKILFSIAILKFNKGSREAYHTHAFNALTWWLKGKVKEASFYAIFNGHYILTQRYDDGIKEYKPSIVPKYTSRLHFHKIIAIKDTFALTLRGPWNDLWFEFKNDKLYRLTHGRKEIK